jgi:hypothetical protein
MTDNKRWSLTPKSGVFDRETLLVLDRVEVDFNGYRYFVNDDRLFIHPEDVTGKLMAAVHPTLYEGALGDDGLVSFNIADFEDSDIEWPNVTLIALIDRISTTYYINKDQLGETTDAEAADYLAAVQEALPIDVVLRPEGQPQSNTSEVESLYGDLVEQIWGSAYWYTPENHEEGKP